MTRLNISPFALVVLFCASSLVAAGELDPQQQEWYARYKKQGNAPRPEEMLLNTDSEPNLSDGFTSLFNGKDLTGWTTKGGKSTFAVSDGLLVGTCVRGSKSTYLCTEQADFTDFVFTCDMKWEVDCDSGVMFRARTKPDHHDAQTVFGPQAEMEGFAKDRHWSGGIYGQSCGGYFYPLWLKEHKQARAAAKEGEWNRLTISAKGNVVKTWVNGLPAAHWIDDGAYPGGFFGLQIHKAVKGKVLWKNIRVKRLELKPIVARKPNVVFILADDLGVNDISLYGSQFHETPNIDVLAERGMMFTQAYAANPLCSPTRSSILTGLYPSRIGITMPHCHKEVEILEKRLAASTPPRQKAIPAETLTRLDTEYFTLAEAFKANGYSTAHFGKWHLGAEPYSPLEQGFDIDIPHTPAPSPLPAGFFHPFPVWSNHGKSGDHLEDLVADAAVDFIHQHKDKPFYLNYWAFEVHSPWQAKKHQIDKYRAKADPDSPRRNPVYAGMIETMDEVVGRLVEALDQAGVLDDTIIVFTSDNGPYIKPNKPHMPKEFWAVPVSSAHPLRDGKGTIFEGGTRIPLVVVWPGRVKAGSKTDALQQSTDFFPTFAGMLGWDLPKGLSFDGVSMQPLFEDNKPIRDEIFCHYPHKTPSTSLRKGDWKLIRWYADNPDQTDRYELFNLAQDIGESKNRAEANQEVVDNLSTRMDVLLKETEAVIPIPNPKYQGTTAVSGDNR